MDGSISLPVHNGSHHHHDQLVSHTPVSTDDDDNSVPVNNGSHTCILAKVKAQVMTRDDLTGGWIPISGGGLSNVMLIRKQLAVSSSAVSVNNVISSNTTSNYSPSIISNDVIGCGSPTFPSIYTSTSHNNNQSPSAGPCPVAPGHRVTEGMESNNNCEYIIVGTRNSDKNVVMNCTIEKDFVYNKVMPTFYHWTTGNTKYGLTFVNATEAKKFDSAINDFLIDGLGLCGNGDYVVDADGSLASGPRYESVLVIKKIIEATNHSMQQPSNFPSPTMSGCCKFPELEVFTPASPFSSKKQEKSKIRLITRSKFNIFRNSFRCVTSVWTKIRNLIVLKTYLNLSLTQFAVTPGCDTEMKILKPCPPLLRHFVRPIHDFINNKISYRFGQSDDPLIPLTIPEILLKSVEKHPDKDCIISHHQSITKTYHDLDHDSNLLANGLKSLGVKRGDPIGIWSGNCYEWIIVQFATAKLGAILVNINPGYKENELEYCLNLVGVKMIISSQRYKSTNYVDIINNVCPKLFSPSCNVSKVPTLEKVIFLDNPGDEVAPRESLKLTQLMSGSRSDPVMDKKITFDDPINVQFTSGTTGTPKGATLTHFGVVNNAYFSGKRMFKQLPIKRICVPNPLYHCFGSINGSLQTIIHDGTLILPGVVANPKSTLEAIDKYHPDIVYGTPTMFTDIANVVHVKKYHTSSVRRFIMSGAPCPVELLTKLSSIFPSSTACIPYGTTETSPVITSTDPIDHDRKYLTSSVGTVLDHVEVKLADPSSGDVVQVGHRGEVLTRGYHTFPGYFNQKDKTNEVLDDRKWYHTGDIAIMNEDGFISIVGRIKDMIIRGGENIYPREIEDFLLKYDIIADVNVVGVPDFRMGEEVCACVILKHATANMTESELKEKIMAFCKGKIAHFKVPKYVLLMNEFPRTITMKIQKNKLRLIACERLKLLTEDN